MNFLLNGMTESFTEELNKNIKPGSNVYIVGWRKDSLLWPYDFFLSKKCKVNLIEIFPKNASAFPKEKYPDVNVICDDVQNYRKHLLSHDNNLIYWGEGPEHLEMEVSKNLLNEMKNFFYTIIIHTPYGEYKQGPMYGNDSETHLSTWFDHDYEELGFKHNRFHGPSRNYDAIIGFWTNQ